MIENVLPLLWFSAVGNQFVCFGFCFPVVSALVPFLFFHFLFFSFRLNYSIQCNTCHLLEACAHTHFITMNATRKQRCANSVRHTEAETIFDAFIIRIWGRCFSVFVVIHFFCRANFRFAVLFRLDYRLEEFRRKKHSFD